MVPTSAKTPAPVPALTTKQLDPGPAATPVPAELVREPNPGKPDAANNGQGSGGNAPDPANNDQGSGNNVQDPASNVQSSGGNAANPANPASNGQGSGGNWVPGSNDPPVPIPPPQSPPNAPPSGSPVAVPVPPQPAAGAVDPAAKPTPALGDVESGPPANLPPQGGSSQPSQREEANLGSLIINGFGGNGPQDSSKGGSVLAVPIPASGTQKVTMNDGQILVVDPTKVVVGGVSYTAGGPPVTLPNVVISFVPNAASGGAGDDGAAGSNEAAGSNGNFAPNVAPVLTTLGQTITPNPSRMVVAGTTLLPGGSPLTLSDTLVSLDTSGQLHIGSSIIPTVPQSVFTVGSKTFTANPAGFTIGSTSLTPSGPAETVDGTTISLDRAGHLQIGSSTLTLPSPTPGSVFTIGTNTITANPSGFTIGSTSLIPGGAPQTIDGTVISLDQSGHLQIGTSTLNIASPLPTAFGDVITTDNLTIQPGVSAIIVDGITIRPGAPGVTIDGNVVSLESGGILDVGSGRIPIPTGFLNGTGAVSAFRGAQGRAYRVEIWSLWGAMAGTVVWTFELV